MITFQQVYLHKNRSFFEVLPEFYFQNPNDKKGNGYNMKKVCIHKSSAFNLDYEELE